MQMSSTFGDLAPKDRLGVSAGELTGSAPNPWDAPKAMRIIVAICKQHRGVGIGGVGMGGFGMVRTLRGVCFENDADISLAVLPGAILPVDDLPEQILPGSSIRWQGSGAPGASKCLPGSCPFA